MQLETIVRAAIRDVRAGRLKPHCGDMPKWINEDDPLNEINWADGYAEPGYRDPAKGILFADWNNYPSKLTDVLERAGYAIEWSDEWGTCEDCGKAIRTSADSYHWEMYGAIVNDCALVCRDCIDWEDRLTEMEDDPTMACPSDVDPAEYGYRRLSDSREYENGFHPGQTDDPSAILKALQARGLSGVLFRIGEVSQFYVRFETWIKETEDESC